MLIYYKTKMVLFVLFALVAVNGVEFGDGDIKISRELIGEGFKKTLRTEIKSVENCRI